MFAERTTTIKREDCGANNGYQRLVRGANHGHLPDSGPWQHEKNTEFGQKTSIPEIGGFGKCRSGDLPIDMSAWVIRGESRGIIQN
jgi:hypothetical protein